MFTAFKISHSFHRKEMFMIKGTLYGVGVGPGDPRLMTYLAVDTIQKCPVIAVPADGKENAVSYKIKKGDSPKHLCFL